MAPMLTIFLLLLAALAVAGGTTYPDAASAVAAHCSGTLYPDLCRSTLSAVPDLHKLALPDVICSSLNATEPFIAGSESNCSSYLTGPRIALPHRDKIAVEDCVNLLKTTLRDLRTAIGELRSPKKCRTSAKADVMTVLSAAMTNQATCLDGFAYEHAGGPIRPRIEAGIIHIARCVSNALAMSSKLNGTGGPYTVKDGFPEWLRAGDRRLLQSPSAAASANAVVAKDGSGNFTTVSAAVAAAPNNSASRYVIYIKAGAYLENVEVGTSKKNLFFVGDGIGKTVIKASRNVVDGWTTFRSATVAVVGDGFLARDLTIENAAGAAKHQAVALRVGADFSALYRCSFVGFQDTLYAHSLRQFYRECDIYGTVDYIFGNAAVVFQSCNIYSRAPLPQQSNTITAQGREDPNQNTGISIQGCKVAAAADLVPVQANFKTYLGRPWKEYSRTVFLQSNLGSLIDPAGWLPWSGSFALSTLYYGEYQNTGPGASTAKRVNWTGYHVITDAAVASQFTVKAFIQGDQWIPSTVPFTAGLS